jgi:predicted enzyme related to lactoylglutathione lyase
MRYTGRMTNPMNPVVHFEMPAEDRARMIEFYTKTFGWKANQLGPEMANYVTVDTSERGENRLPKKPGMINGGFHDKTADAAHPSIVIGVEDIHAHAKKVQDAGGKVLGHPVEIPGIGWLVVFIDTEGNRVSMIQPTGMN